ncbi:MAG: TRAP transporter small permease [Clostridia bacterium]|nr:TRAP transporter small permease [Clostridia bacterium]
MKVLKKIGNAVDAVCGGAAVLMIAVMVVVTFAQIVWRFGSSYISWMRPLSWSEELTRFLLVWASFIGATCAYRHGANIAITAVQNAVPPTAQKVMRVLVHVVCFVLFAAVAYYGFSFCARQRRTTDALPINVPMKYVYMCIPVSMCIMMYHAFTMVLELLTGKEEN